MRCFAFALRLVVLLTLPLVLNLAAPGCGLAAESVEPDARADAVRLERRIDDLEKKLDSYKTQEEIRWGAEEKVAAERMAGVQKRVDDALGRIGDMSTSVTILGALITIVLFCIGVFAYFGAGKQAGKEAKEWLNDNRKKHDDELKKWLNECRVEFEESINELTKKLEARIDQKMQHADNRLQCFDDDLNRLLTKAQQSMGKDGGLSLSREDSKALDDAANKLKDEDEKSLTYKDWKVKAFAAYEKYSYAEAVRCLEKIAGDSEAPCSEKATAIFNQGIILGDQGDLDGALAAFDDVIRRFGESNEPAVWVRLAKTLVNKGATLKEMNNIEGALAAFTEVIVRFHNSTEPGLQEPLAVSLVNMGTLHNRLGKTAKTVSCYEEVIHKYGDSNEQGLQTQVAKAYSGLGYERLLQAKQVWNAEPQRLGLLDDALKDIEKGMAHVRREDRIEVLGNKAYALFLVGRQDEAKPALLRALKRGGQTLYNDKVFDSQCHPVPKDEAFRALLDECWAQVKPTLPRSMGGTADGPGDAPSGDSGGEKR